jgi:hypothetical protein
MQSASISLPPQQNDEHLSPVPAKMFLAALPERIQRALLVRSRETQYLLEVVLEVAFTQCFCKRIAGFLDGEAITFVDCCPEDE